MQLLMADWIKLKTTKYTNNREAETEEDKQRDSKRERERQRGQEKEREQCIEHFHDQPSSYFRVGKIFRSSWFV